MLLECILNQYLAYLAMHLRDLGVAKISYRRGVIGLDLHILSVYLYFVHY